MENPKFRAAVLRAKKRCEDRHEVTADQERKLAEWSRWDRTNLVLFSSSKKRNEAQVKQVLKAMDEYRPDPEANYFFSFTQEEQAKYIEIASKLSTMTPEELATWAKENGYD